MKLHPQVSTVRRFLYVAVSSLGLASPAAFATVITFEPIPEQGITLDAGDSIAAQAVLFTQLNDSPATLFAGETAGAYAGNGSSSSLFAGNAALFSLTAASGAFFGLGSLELGGGNLGDVASWATEVLLSGLMTDYTVLSQLVVIDATSSGLTLVNLGWNNLVRVDFSVAAGDYSIDNVDVLGLEPVAVSEPGAMLLFGIALAGLSFRRRPRRSQLPI